VTGRSPPLDSMFPQPPTQHGEAPARPNRLEHIEMRSAELFAGVHVAMRIADELGIPTSDTMGRDAVVATVVAARAHGRESREELLELARLTLETVRQDTLNSRGPDQAG
jgi:hypothetical protein